MYVTMLHRSVRGKNCALRSACALTFANHRMFRNPKPEGTSKPFQTVSHGCYAQTTVTRPPRVKSLAHFCPYNRPSTRAPRNSDFSPSRNLHARVPVGIVDMSVLFRRNPRRTGWEREEDGGSGRSGAAGTRDKIFIFDLYFSTFFMLFQI